MTLKRQGAIQTYNTPAKRMRMLEKRVTKLSRRVNNKLVYQTQSRAVAVANTTADIQPIGTSGASNARILYVEVMGVVQGYPCDVYIVSTNDTSDPPVYADFNPNTGGYLLNQSDTDVKHIWQHKICCPYESSTGFAAFKMAVKFPKGFIYKIDNLGNTIGKCLYIAFKNDSGAGANIKYSVKIYYQNLST